MIDRGLRLNAAAIETYERTDLIGEHRAERWGGSTLRACVPFTASLVPAACPAEVSVGTRRPLYLRHKL